MQTAKCKFCAFGYWLLAIPLKRDLRFATIGFLLFASVPLCLCASVPFCLFAFLPLCLLPVNPLTC
jgi:hypothetical protein